MYVRMYCMYIGPVVLNITFLYTSVVCCIAACIKPYCSQNTRYQDYLNLHRVDIVPMSDPYQPFINQNINICL